MAPSAVTEIPKKEWTPKAFYEAQDWEQWYHEFATESVRGVPKYTSTFSFAQAKGKTQQERDTILYIIGPKVNKPGHAQQYVGLEQFEWDRRRKDGFWLGPEPLKNQIDKLLKQDDSISAVRAASQEFLLPLIAKCAGMMDKIEASFSGQLFMPGLSDKQNEARANLYMRLVDQTTKQVVVLQEAYARSLMININDMLGTVAVREHVASTMNADAANKQNGTLAKIIEMVATKGQALKLPLPDADIGKIALAAEKAS